MNVRLFLVWAAAATALRAAPDSAEELRDSESRQQQLLTETRGLVEQLDAVLGEYSRNGLAGEDVTTVERLRTSLNRLTVSEMQAVLSLLQRARTESRDGAAKRTVADAYAAQKMILAKMDQLLAEHARAQEALELSQATARLADRQADNLQNGIELGKWVGGKKPENFEQAMQANLHGQSAEQAALEDDSKALSAKLADFLQQAPSAEVASRFEKAVADLQQTQSKIASAAAALKEGQLFKAVAQEKEARDSLRAIARHVALPRTESELLRAAARDLSRLLEEQTQIAGEAAKASSDFSMWVDSMAKLNPIDGRWRQPVARLRADEQLLKQFEAAKRERIEQLPALENTQGDVANKSDLLAQDIGEAAPAAADLLRGAQSQMQEARVAMTDKAAAPAAQASQLARSSLERTLAEISRRAAELAAAAGRMTGDPMRDRQALQDAVSQLARQQAAAAAQRNAAAQAAVAQQAQQLARQAARLAPNAAPALQQAAQLAQQAARAANAQQAAAAQQGAAQQLALAAQQIAQQIAAAQQAQQRLAIARRAGEELAKIIQAEQKLYIDTSTAQAQFTKGKEQLFAGLDARQRSIREDTEFFREQTGGFTSRESLQDAVHNMRRAAQALDKPDGEVAVEAEQSALDDLFRARAALDQQTERLRDEAGEPNVDQEAIAATAAQIVQAQAALAAAQQALAQGEPAQAVPQAAQAAQIAGQAAAQGALPPAASQALQAAARQATQASAQAAGNQASAATASALAAQQSLAQAQSALSASQSGLSVALSNSASGQKGSGAARADSSGNPSEVNRGDRGVVSDSSRFANLPARDRAAIQQSAGEKYPREYGPMVEQYLRNLADDSTKGQTPPARTEPAPR
jgi:hypothetical protein